MKKETMIIIGVILFLIGAWWIVNKKPAADEVAEPVLVVPDSVKDVDPSYSDRIPNNEEVMIISDIQEV